MAGGPLKRKLSAILAADAVSYSRKMSENEEGTMRVLSAHRAVIDGIIEFHEGRIANTAGDSVLAEFASPVEAVRCAVEIQDALRTRNDSLPQAQRLEFRVGVNLGDVMVKGHDLLGDGVNVAARLESIAEPGGICISSSIYDMIRGKLDLGFVDIGEQSLKNIEHPIRAYRVDRDGVASAEGAGVRKEARRSRWPALAGAVALIAALAAAWHWNLLPQMPWDAAQQRQAEAGRRAKIEADLARARAEAEAAQKKAEAEAGAAAQARRALEEQRVAASRAAAAAEMARARAEADAVRRKAEAELSAAKQALERAEREARERERERQAAAAAAAAQQAQALSAASAAASAKASTASSTAARWSASLHCEPWRNVGAANFSLSSTFGSSGFELTRGQPDEPGYLLLRGNPGTDGRLVLTGNGKTGLRSRRPGTPYQAQFEGMLQAGAYEGQGSLGIRPCVVRLSRAAQ